MIRLRMYAKFFIELSLSLKKKFMYRRALSNDSQVTQYTTLMIYEANVDEK